jgi:hypothetical protein
MTVGVNWRKSWEFKLILKCKHQCHCTCSSEIGTCLINNAGRQAAHKKNERKYMFYTHVLKVYRSILTFNAKKNFQKNYQTYKHYPFKAILHVSVKSSLRNNNNANTPIGKLYL